MQKQTLQVEGMSCNHCVNTIEKALREIGVAGKVNLSNGSVEVEYDDAKVKLDTIKETIEEQGYEVV